MVEVVQPGDVVRRVIRTRKFAVAITLQMIICGGVHVLVGYLQQSCFGQCEVPMPGVGNDACLLPGVGRIHIISEVFIDAFLTSFFISGVSLAGRTRDVRNGTVPPVSPEAFPRGAVLSLLYPRCGPITRRERRLANVRSWVGITITWGTLWGTFTMLTAFVLYLVPVDGPAGERFCLSPWQFIYARALWTDIEAVLVAVGSFVLWCTRAPRPADRELYGSVASVASSPRAKLLHEDPLVVP